jgi:hypothetical protein
MTSRPFLAVALAAVLTGCASTPATVQPAPIAQDELTKALKEAATRAVDVRVRLAAMQPMAAVPAQGSAPESVSPPTAKIDIDYVGPVENASKLLSRTLGWEISVSGKKRGDVIVSLRHEQQDAVTILRDIGTQCGHKCDVHVEIVEGSKSSISLSYRD